MLFRSLIYVLNNVLIEVHRVYDLKFILTMTLCVKSEVHFAVSEWYLAEAIRINDKKAQCLALTIPVIYYFNNGKTELLEKAISRLQEISRKNNYLQYYYFGSIYKVNYLMNTGNTLRALQEAELTKEQAFADDYPYGISTCLRMMGNIYFARRENRTALDY